MSQRKQSVKNPKFSTKEAHSLIRALKTNQVDGIVGERHIMYCRLREAEERLESSRDQARSLVNSLISVREDERTAIAREIHDELGQTLAGLDLGLSWLARKVTPRQKPLQKKIESLSNLVKTMMKSIQRISEELRPGILEEVGLIKALESEARQFEENTEIPWVLVSNLEKVKFNPGGSLAIYRIVQAALTNISFHSNATRVRITLEMRKNFLIMMVKDNGDGINGKKVTSPDSLGIIGMRERTLALDGTFSIRGSKGNGTTITVRMPLSRVLIGHESRIS